MLLLLSSGCKPCATPEVVDVTERANEPMLAGVRRVMEEWFTQSASEECLTTVLICEMEEDYGLGEFVDGKALGLGFETALSPYLTRKPLCERLDPRFDGASVASVCAEGPRYTDFSDAVIAACGTVDVGEEAAWVRDNVWTAREPERAYSPLGMEDRGEISVAIEASYIAAGGGYAAFETPTEEAAEISFVDVEDGSVRSVVMVDDYGGLVSAPSAVVHIASDVTDYRVTTLTPDSVTHAVGVDRSALFDTLAADDQTLFTDGEPELPSLKAVALESGSVTELPLPSVPGDLTPVIGGLAVADGGLLARVIPSRVTVSNDFVGIGMYDTVFQRYDLTTETWSEVGRDFDFFEIGVTATGPIFGILRVAAGDLYAAWDPATDEWWINETECASGQDWPSVVVDDTVVWAYSGTDTTTLHRMSLHF